MVSRSSAFAVASAFALVASANLFAQGKAPADANSRKLSDAQKREIQAAITIADSAMAGQAAPNDLSLSWVREDVLKATDTKEYVPFTVSIDPSKAPGGTVWLYWRVAPKGATLEPPAAAGKNEKPPARPTFAYEDIGTAQVVSGQSPMLMSRSFTVGAGEYDVYVVAKEPTPEKPAKNAAPPKTSVIKQTVTVPDYWNGELNTSTVIVAARIDPLPAPLTQQQQIERPYALGGMEIVPSTETKFTKKAELQPFLLIYNPKTDAANKPDITVEFNFFTKEAAGEKPFNHTAPQNLNASTLPPQFDFSLGHQLQTGQAIPLASFPEGNYRLEIKVTDKLANKSITRDVNFTVSGS
jgi:hypothetical protein